MPPTELSIEFTRQLTTFGDAPRIIVALARAIDPLAPDRETDIKIVGPAEEGALEKGNQYTLYGTWRDDPKNGRQFKFVSFARSAPHTRRGVIRWLQDVDGIGVKRATAIWETFGADAIELIRSDPAAIAERVKGVTLAVLARAGKFLSEMEHEKEVRLSLYDLLDGRGFPRSLPEKCIDTWGNAAPALIRDNPYRLSAFPRVGFGRCDQLYLDIGGDPANPERQVHLIRHLVEDDNSGSTWVKVGEIETKFRGKMSAANLDFRTALGTAEDRGYVEINYLPGAGEVVASALEATAEKVIADRLTVLLAGDAEWPSVDAVTEIADDQRAALARAMKGQVGILTGPPGTGKTFVLARYLRRLQLAGETNFVVVAPTGKAARRITEVMQAYGVNKPAITIHRLLHVKKVDNSEGFEFSHGAGNPLPHRWIFVDEMSMVDGRLMAAFLSACSDSTHLLFVGDDSQLPPVGRGAPGRDMIRAGVPTGELTAIHRNDGRIVQACREIIRSSRFTPSLALNIRATPPENLVIFGEGTAARQIARCEHFVRQAAEAGGRDPKWDIQLLCAVNKSSKVSRLALNAHFQEVLNPDGERAPRSPFRVGDKVVNRENSWPRLVEPAEAEILFARAMMPGTLAREYAAGWEALEKNEAGECWVANGDMGEVVAVEERLTVVRFEAPVRVVKVPRSSAGDNSGGVDGGGGGGGTGCKLELGYAISGHLSQGSQWPYVVVFLDDYPGARMVTSRNWLYTCISRAETACVLIGKREVAMEMCRRDAMAGRRTGLVERMERGRRSMEALLAGVGVEWGEGEMGEKGGEDE